MALFLEPEEESLLVKVAWYYYEQGLTQEEIGKKMGYSRTKIVRLLAKARKNGIVQINITSNYRVCLEKEEALKKKFGLKEAIVILTGKDFSSTRFSVGKACASYLGRVLEKGDSLGVAWGRTLYEVGRHLNSTKDLGLTVIQLMGGLNANEELNPQEIVKLIASNLKANGIWLNTPAVVATKDIKEALLSDSGVQNVLTRARTCRIALLGIGDVTSTASLVVSNALSLGEMKLLKSLGAVGDIMGWHFDINGKQIVSPVSERVISFPLDELYHIPLRIGVAVGEKKILPFLGALRGKHINVIITDEVTAERILEEADR